MADIIKELLQARQNTNEVESRVALRAAINDIYKLRGKIKDAKVMLSAGIKMLGSGVWESDEAEELPDVQPPKPYVPAKGFEDDPF